MEYNMFISEVEIVLCIIFGFESAQSYNHIYNHDFSHLVNYTSACIPACSFLVFKHIQLIYLFKVDIENKCSRHQN